jgi:hypothetical protein
MVTGSGEIAWDSLLGLKGERLRLEKVPPAK